MWVGEQTPLAKVDACTASSSRLSTRAHTPVHPCAPLRTPCAPLCTPVHPCAPLVHPACDPVHRSLQVYFRRFELSPIRLNITYLHSQKLVADLIRNPATTLLPNLDRAPIVLDAMVLQDTVTTADELQSAIKLSYKSALLRQFYKLLLRVDMLSVPVRP